MRPVTSCSAFPLLHDNFQLYNLILRGLLTSLLFSILVTLICGGFTRNARPQSNFTVTANNAVKHGAWLPLVYIVLYMLFGYFVAWQVRELRLFYGGPAELNGFFEQWELTAIAKPEFPVFQYFRGILWILCLVPLFMGFTGRRAELVILSGACPGPSPNGATGLCQSAHAGRHQSGALLGSRNLDRDIRSVMCLVHPR